MEKFIPYEKCSKKQKRALDRAKRGTWGELKPVTRTPANPKAYNRKKARRWRCDDRLRAFCFSCRAGGTVLSFRVRYAMMRTE